MTNDQPLTVNIISETPFTVQGHGVHTAYMESMDALRSIGVKVITNTNEPADIVHIHTIGPYALWKCLWNQKKLVITAHVIPDSFVGSIVGSHLWLPLARWYLKVFYGLAEHIIAVSPDVKKELESMGITKPISFLPNSVNLEKFKPDTEKRNKMRENLGIPQDTFVVMNTGQIQPRKGISSFIETARKLPNITFLWIGGMPFKKLAADHAAMEELMKEAPDNVIFPGIVPLEEMPNYYQAGDALFFPSFQENFPFTIIEAAASHLPILLRDIDLYKTIFGDNYLPGTDETFTDIITKLSSDKAYYAAHAQKAQNIAETYASSKIAQQLLEIYKAILQKTHTSTKTGSETIE